MVLTVFVKGEGKDGECEENGEDSEDSCGDSEEGWDDQNVYVQDNSYDLRTNG